MALSVEFAVLEELADCHLLASLEHLLEQAEGDFGGKQLVMVSIMTVHLGALPPNL